MPVSANRDVVLRMVERLGDHTEVRCAVGCATSWTRRSPRGRRCPMTEPARRRPPVRRGHLHAWGVALGRPGRGRVVSATTRGSRPGAAVRGGRRGRCAVAGLGQYRNYQWLGNDARAMMRWLGG